MKALTIFSGLLMIGTAVFCLMNPGQTFLTMAFLIGAVMVVCGNIHALSYLIGRGMHNKGDNNGWILIDGLMTLLLGILILCNQLVVDTAIPMIFGMWVLFSGLLRIEASSHINKEKKPLNFRATLVTGILTTAIGLFGFVNPLVSFMSVITLVGIFLFMQGVNALELGINMPHERKSYIRIYKRNKERVKIVDERDEKPESIAGRFNDIEKRKAREVFDQTIATENIGIPIDNTVKKNSKNKK